MTVNAFLATAVRRVNARYAQVEDPESIDIFTDRWRHLERQVDTALAAGDDLAAERAIRAWEHHALVTFTEMNR